MFGIGWSEILVILVIALLLLGPSKLPEIAKGLGKGIRDFRKALSDVEDEVTREVPPPKKASYCSEVPEKEEQPPNPPATHDDPKKPQ